jgi:Ribonucleotide reductase alpha domain
MYHGALRSAHLVRRRSLSSLAHARFHSPSSPSPSPSPSHAPPWWSSAHLTARRTTHTSANNNQPSGSTPWADGYRAHEEHLLSYADLHARPTSVYASFPPPLPSDQTPFELRHDDLPASVVRPSSSSSSSANSSSSSKASSSDLSSCGLPGGTLGEVVYRRTYARPEDNAQWSNTVRRVVEGTYRMQQWYLSSPAHPAASACSSAPASSSQCNNHTHSESRFDMAKARDSAAEMYERILRLDFVPPGRGLWAMGTPLSLPPSVRSVVCVCVCVCVCVFAFL